MEASGGERSANHDAFFREVNDRIDEVAATLGDDDHRYEYVCECVDPTCTERIELSRAQYQSIRTDGARFVLAPGHTSSVLEPHPV
jgi:hypothetical protein